MASNANPLGPSTRGHGPTTNRTRRHTIEHDGQTGRLATTRLAPAPPPTPKLPPRPLGELSQTPAQELVALAGKHFGSGRTAVGDNRRGMRWLLEELARFPGVTWQQRWEAAGLNHPGHSVAELGGTDSNRRCRISAAALQTFCMRLIQPSLAAFAATPHTGYAERFRRIAKDPLLEEFRERVLHQPVTLERQRLVMMDICCALTVYGIGLADITPEALLDYANATQGSAAAVAWPVLRAMGVFPASAPRSLQDARTPGQRSIEELVDRHQLRNTEVRDLLVDYIRRRSVEIDYATLDNLVRSLVLRFWKVIEDISPDQADLRLDQATVQEWKQRLLVREDGKPRMHIDGPFLAVRAFYLDLQSWAAAEPERWGRWVAPCPIRDTDLRWFTIRRRRLAERMANRTRDRQPLLPILSEHVYEHWQALRALLDRAGEVPLGGAFTLNGVAWQRTATSHDQEQADHPAASIRVVNPATGELLRLSHEEDQAFWQWAIVETLRLAGLRVEELVELTHLSVRQYRRPSGEVVALLVVSPSKSDRERVIPMSADLFHVVAQVIRRHLGKHRTVPVCVRYDMAERTWSEPLPFLFQRIHSGSPRGMSVMTVRAFIRRAAEALVPRHPEFAEIRFAPHDFRRLFATELVNNGLPIHIGAALLGHLDIQTTRGYVAVFPEDVITHYQLFLARRRAQRPDGEYRKPNGQEWQDFQQHFDKRKVELGSCGRPYGTPCQHEHACIRCPMLSLNPKMLPRLDELEADLLARGDRALAEGWHGEVEGINLTLTFLRAKRTQAQRAAAMRAGRVMLGMPGRPGR